MMRPLALLRHRANNRLSKTKRAAQVCADNSVPIFQDIRMASASRVTPALFTRMSALPNSFENLATDFLDGSMIRDIDRVRFRRIRAKGVDFICDILGVLLRSADASDPRAFTGEP